VLVLLLPLLSLCQHFQQDQKGWTLLVLLFCCCWGRRLPLGCW
jgi:hypothetical protein